MPLRENRLAGDRRASAAQGDGLPKKAFAMPLHHSCRLDDDDSFLNVSSCTSAPPPASVSPTISPVSYQEGTSVYGADNKIIGSVQRIMIDKISGKVAYAVIRSALTIHDVSRCAAKPTGQRRLSPQDGWEHESRVWRP